MAKLTIHSPLNPLLLVSEQNPKDVQRPRGAENLDQLCHQTYNGREVRRIWISCVTRRTTAERCGESGSAVPPDVQRPRGAENLDQLCHQTYNGREGRRIWISCVTRRTTAERCGESGLDQLSQEPKDRQHVSLGMMSGSDSCVCPPPQLSYHMLLIVYRSTYMQIYVDINV